MLLFTDEEIEEAPEGEDVCEKEVVDINSIRVVLVPIYKNSEHRRKVKRFLDEFYDLENSEIGVGWYDCPSGYPDASKEEIFGDVKIIAGIQSVEKDGKLSGKVEVYHDGNSEYIHKDKIDSDFIESLTE